MCTFLLVCSDMVRYRGEIHARIACSRFALLLIHFLGCFAGYQVAKDAFGGAFNSEHLTIGAKRWRLNRGKDDDSGEPSLSLSLSPL